MLDILFGWRKASKCKRLIRRVQCRLKLLKNRRYSIMRQLREDVAQLIKTGYEEIAIERAEQLFKDESIMAVYELLDHFCEFILIRLSYIRRHRDCPNDINEAVSSLVYASARCGDLPELRAIRKLFGERYGDILIKGALELYPGNLVNSEIRDKLSIKSVHVDVKLRLVDEISRDYCLQPEILALEYASELQKQIKEIMEPHVIDANAQLFLDRIEESKLQVLDPNRVETKSVLVDSIIGDELVMTPVTSSLDSNGSPGMVKLERASECKERATGTSSSSSSSGNSPRFYREKVMYLDDVEEVQSPLKVNMNHQDQRLFKFKPSPVSRKETPEEGYSEEGDSWCDSPVTIASRKNQRGPEKRIRRGPTSRENRGLESIEFGNYYNGPNRNPGHKSWPYQQRNKHQKKHETGARNRSFGSKTKLELSMQHSISIDPCCKVKECSLEHPCYDYVSDEKNNLEDVMKLLMSEPKSAASARKQERILSSENVAVVSDAFTYPDYKPSKRYAEMKQTEDGLIYEKDSSSSSSGEDDWDLPPYSRAMTMPPQRPREIQSEKIPRSNSCPFQNPNHVHPKLPDYDEIAAKFSALKKEYLRSKDRCGKHGVP